MEGVEDDFDAEIELCSSFEGSYSGNHRGSG